MGVKFSVQEIFFFLDLAVLQVKDVRSVWFAVFVKFAFLDLTVLIPGKVFAFQPVLAEGSFFPYLAVLVIADRFPFSQAFLVMQLEHHLAVIVVRHVIAVESSVHVGLLFLDRVVFVMADDLLDTFFSEER
jgi:hypothetical protein